MSNKTEKPPLIVPLLLALTGIVALGTAVALVKPYAMETFGQDRTRNNNSPRTSKLETEIVPQTVLPVQPTETDADASDPPEPTVRVDNDTATEAEVVPPAPNDAVEPETASAVPANTPSGNGPWTIVVDSSSYEPDQAGEAAIGSVVGALRSDESRKLKLTGVNHPNKSSKRARFAAKKLRDRIVKELGDGADRVSVGAEQKPGVEGTEVIAELVGGGQ